jgi:hypothetical protein
MAQTLVCRISPGLLKLLAMGPKKTPIKDALSKGGEKVVKPEDVKKVDFSNYKSHLKAVSEGADPKKAAEAKQQLELYEGLGRFDKLKGKIVSTWLSHNKKLGPWMNSFTVASSVCLLFGTYSINLSGLSWQPCCT